MGLAKVGDIVRDPSVLALAKSDPVWVVFFKISCPVCQLSLPYWNRLHPATRVYAISQNNEIETGDFRAEFELTLPTVLDPEDTFPASNAFGITHVPTAFLVEPGGRVAQVIEGWDKRAMQRLGAVEPQDRVPEFKAG